MKLKLKNCGPLAAVLGLLACSSPDAKIVGSTGDQNESNTDDSSDEAAPTVIGDLQSALHFRDLPECKRSLQNAVYYVYKPESRVGLYYCKSPIWVKLNITPGGSSSIAVRVDDAPFETCPNGGKKIMLGEDTNGNGRLDDAEIEEIAPVCNGAVGPTGPRGPTGPQGPAGSGTGSAGPQTLVSVAPASTTQCAEGGTLINVGVDDNQNGSLQPGEIDATQIVCNGLNGVNGSNGAAGPQGATGPQGPAGSGSGTSVTGPQGPAGATGPQGATGPTGPGGTGSGSGSTGPQGATGPTGPKGANGSAVAVTPASATQCPTVGVVVSQGQDDDGDGVLDAGEVETVQVVCNGAIGPTGPQGPAGGGTGPTGGGPSSVCGNGVIENTGFSGPDEVCDGTTLPAGTPAGSTCALNCLSIIPPVVEPLSVCGNNTVENVGFSGIDEVCDGTNLGTNPPANSTCNSTCTGYDAVVGPGPNAECTACTQLNCEDQLNSCASGDDNLPTSPAGACQTVLDCVHVSWEGLPDPTTEPSCAIQASAVCYCGINTPSGFNLAQCQGGNSVGVCKEVIRTQSACIGQANEPACILNRQNNTQYGYGDAFQVVNCQRSNCSTECGLDP